MRASRGFTLVELLTSLAVTSVVMLGVTATVIGQARAYDIGARTRDSVGQARSSMSFIERKLELAGYGVDPRFVFDFSGVRDWGTAGPDELVFYSRDPSFRARGMVTGLAGPPGGAFQVDLTEPLKVRLFKGQFVQLVCVSGSRMAVGQVTATTAPGATSLPLSNAPAFSAQQFPGEPARPGACEAAGSPVLVTKVDRYRFFVARVDEGGAAPRSILFLDRGLDFKGGHPLNEPAQGANPELTTWNSPAQLAEMVPLVFDVDDFQVAYFMNRPPLGGVDAVDKSPNGNDNWILGDAPTDVRPVGVDAGVPAPTYDAPYNDNRRFNASSANIRGVRVTVVVRSTFKRASTAGSLNKPIGGENRPASAPDGFARSVLQIEVPTPNLASRSAFAPLVNDPGGG